MLPGQSLNTYRIFKHIAKALIRLRICAGRSEPLLVAHTTLLEIACRGSSTLGLHLRSFHSCEGFCRLHGCVGSFDPSLAQRRYLSHREIKPIVSKALAQPQGPVQLDNMPFRNRLSEFVFQPMLNSGRCTAHV